MYYNDSKYWQDLYDSLANDEDYDVRFTLKGTHEDKRVTTAIIHKTIEDVLPPLHLTLPQDDSLCVLENTSKDQQTFIFVRIEEGIRIGEDGLPSNLEIINATTSEYLLE